MPIIKVKDYHPGFWFRNNHINTLYPYLFRKNSLVYTRRERIDTTDDDFFDVDWLTENSPGAKLIILCHGLEGSSHSQYIRGTARTFYQHGYHVAALNFRSCSGEMNRQKVMYHSGWTQDLDHFINKCTSVYDQIYICGFSLGGNVTLKYVCDGHYTINTRIKAVAAISVPCDLRACSLVLLEKKNYIYSHQFLTTLSKKIRYKHIKIPDLIDVSHLSKIKNLWDFDDYYSGPLHGFRDAEDYYYQCNSLQFLHRLKIPALMINSLDDSFLADSAYPYDIAEKNDYLHLMTPKFGGHVGFVTSENEYYWNEQKVLEFFNKF